MKEHEIYDALREFGIDADKETRHDRVLGECLQTLKEQRKRIGDLLSANNDTLARARLKASFDFVKDFPYAIVYDPKNESGMMNGKPWKGMFQKAEDRKETFEISGDDIVSVMNDAVKAREEGKI